MATLLKTISKEEIIQDSLTYNTHSYVEWAQKLCRNTDEYNFILSIKDNYDRTLIVTNANLFFEIQNLLKIKKPYIHELTFEKVLEYVYLNRIYYDIWYDGYYFHYSMNENLPNDAKIREFIRLHFDPTAKKLTGSSMDKVVYWIKEGYSLDSIVETLKHYYDHKKMYYDSNIFIENLTCDDFLKLSNSKQFIVFKHSYLIFKRLTEEMRVEITNNKNLYASFSKLVQDYIQFHKNELHMELFDKTLSKLSNFKNRTAEFIIQLSNSLQGFDFDMEVNQIKNDSLTNKYLKVIAENEDFFIYQILEYETLRIYSSPHWCISRSLTQFDRYISKGDSFYVLLQRNPVNRCDYKLGITVEKSKGHSVIKHSFNYADQPNRHTAQLYLQYFQNTTFFDKVFSIFKKKKNNENENNENEAAIPMFHGEEEEEAEAVEQGDAEEVGETIRPRFTR